MRFHLVGWCGCFFCVVCSSIHNNPDLTCSLTHFIYVYIHFYIYYIYFSRNNTFSTIQMPVCLSSVQMKRGKNGQIRLQCIQWNVFVFVNAQPLKWIWEFNKKKDGKSKWGQTTNTACYRTENLRYLERSIIFCVSIFSDFGGFNIIMLVGSYFLHLCDCD